MGAIGWTPAVRDALNTQVVNKFQAGTLSARVSGLLNICGVRSATAENLVTLVLGKNMQLRKRARGSDAGTKREANIYEQRAKLGNYIDFLSMDRMDAKYDKIDKIMATAESAGLSVAEAPTRMVEALVPTALSLECHTGSFFFDTDHPIKPGSATTFANVSNLGALDFDSYDEAERLFAQMKDEDGRACGSTPTVLAVGSKYKQIGREIVNNSRPKDYAGGDNLRAQDGVQLVVVPDWDDEFWCLFDTRTDSDRGFYFCEGSPIRLKPLHTDIEGAYETINNELLWAVEGDMAAALGNPRRAFMAANPASASAIVTKYSAKFELNDFGFDLA